jgi:carbon-monoxide dehydrogenase iron sulfur subunit
MASNRSVVGMSILEPFKEEEKARLPKSAESIYVEPVKPQNYILYFDYHRCMGCWNCYLACAVEHSGSKNLIDAILERPKPKPRLRVLSLKGSGLPYVVQCMHCEDPPCMKVCPVGAIYKGPDGIVRVDEETCIGCRMCARACPFGAITMDEDKGVALKCDMCEDRLREGLAPACVTACPTGALQYGDIDEILNSKRKEAGERLSQALRDLIEPKPKPKKATYKDAVPSPKSRWW